VTIRLSELFFSLQGEGPLVGFPTFFVRLYGCNLSCSWCDTPQARGGFPFEEKSIDEIISFWQENYPKIPYVAITGGEPLLQKESILLMRSFVAQGAKVLLETNGSLSIREVPQEVLIVMDVKTPSSGMVDFNLWENFKYLKKGDALKFVIANREDFWWSLEIIDTYNLEEFTCFFSPAYSLFSPQELANLILETRRPLRFQIQLHKFLGIK